MHSSRITISRYHGPTKENEEPHRACLYDQTDNQHACSYQQTENQHACLYDPTKSKNHHTRITTEPSLRLSFLMAPSIGSETATIPNTPLSNARERLQYLVLYTYYTDNRQYFRAVRANKTTIDTQERIMTQPYTRKYINSNWFKHSPVRIFTYNCVDAMDIWFEFKRRYADFTYGMYFLSPTTFTFHDELSLRCKFTQDVLSKSRKSQRYPKFSDVDDCLTRCFTLPSNYIVAIQSNIMNVIESGNE